MSTLDEVLQKYGLPTLLYLVCRALGVPVREASRLAGFSARTGRRREQEAWWPAMLDVMRARLHDIDPALPARPGRASPGHADAPDFARTLLPLLPDAVEAYRRLLDEADRLAARDILDRIFGKPATRKVEGQSQKELPPLLVYERYDTPPDDDPPPPPEGAGDLHRQRGGGSDV
ncbi:MAG: hypothetical protein M5R40_14570 [Anaerolineae bacterium]|nr:hypothetical protein [Anaerolineae bacterium]